MGKNRRLKMAYEDDFQYITKIVSSCETYEQLLTSKKLFENFKQTICIDLNRHMI